MNSLSRRLLILVPILLIALLLSTTSAFAGSQFSVGAKKATAASTKVRNAVTQATNIAGPRAEAREMGTCLARALNDPEEIKTGQLYTMIYYAIFDLSGQTYRAIPGTMNWGGAVLDNTASEFHGPNKILKRGLLGLKGQLLIGKSFPASDFCQVVADWQASGYTGAKSLITAEIGPGIYDRTLAEWTKAGIAVSQASRAIKKDAIGNGGNPMPGYQFSNWPQARIMGIMNNTLFLTGESIGVTEG